MEKCNVRYLDTDLIAEPIDFISIDVSFISLKLIFPVAAKVLAEDGEIVCLVKPQFEAGREQVGKKGICLLYTSDQPASDGSSFSEKRANLELQRNDLIAKYDDTIKNSTNDAEKKNAVQKKEKLTEYMEQEVAAENKIKAKNLPDCLVIISDSTVTVTVDEDVYKRQAQETASTTRLP